MDNSHFSTRATVNREKPPDVMVVVGGPSTSWHSHFLNIMNHNDFPKAYKYWRHQKPWGLLLETTGLVGSNKSPLEHPAYQKLCKILLINGFRLIEDIDGNLEFHPEGGNDPTVVKGVAGI